MKRRFSSLSRSRFIALASSAPVALAGCGSGGSSTPTINPTATPSPGPTAPILNPPTTVPDLRYKFAPTIPPSADGGVNPAGDAAALILPTTPSPATSPITGSLSFGTYASNERYVVRVPTNWNGKLVVCGTPAFRSEYANDAIWSDFMLARGYAFACSNKGIPYNAVVETIAASQSPSTAYPIPFDLLTLETAKQTFRLGALTPRSSIAAWNDDFALLTRAVQTFLSQTFGRAPSRTYAVGLSNGGAQVRSLLEQHGDIVDGGVDWSGVYWSTNLNILTYMPKFLAAMPAYVASNFTDAGAAQAIVNAGFPADVLQASAAHPSLWFEYYSNAASFYVDLTVFAYALLIDPTTSSSIAAAGCTPNPTSAARLPGTCVGTGLALPGNRAAYVPSAQANATIATFAHTGRIQKPLVSIAGAVDMFITPQNNATPYLNAVNAAGQGSQYFQYLVQGGTHVDTFAAFNYNLQPQLAFAWAAFDQMVAIVERGFRPSGAGTQQTVTTPNQIVSS